MTVSNKWTRAKYEIVIDGEVVWSGKFPPSDAQVDRIGVRATQDGWNGTTMDLYRAGVWLRFLYPSEEALSAHDLDDLADMMEGK